jgi:cytochrome o ubiquinol oxidase subunit 2
MDLGVNMPVIGRHKRVLAVVLLALAIGGALAALAVYLHRVDIPVLEPKGPIASQEQHLIIITALLSLFVVIPVLGLVVAFAVKYREGNTKAQYSPTLASSKRFETAWWIYPSALIVVLSIITWNSAHSLDPYKPLDSKTPALTIQVVSLDWKWLFIYPDQRVACVNEMVIPNDTPIDLLLTSDAPMNSFWIPQLSGQIYAMPGMQTQLHLEASSAGTFRGLSANISGAGFSSMTFQTNSTSLSAFRQWIDAAQRSPKALNQGAYSVLARPTENAPISCYADSDTSLFSSIILRYMTPDSSSMSMAPGSRSMNMAEASS